MSKSGVPIISDVAQAAVNTANSVSNIASGGNVFENLGRIGLSTNSAFVSTSAQGNAGSKIGSSEKNLNTFTPFVGNLNQSAYNLNKDISSRSKGTNFARQTAYVGASAAGAYLLGPVLAPAYTGANSAVIYASYAAGAQAANYAAKGNFSAIGGIFGSQAKDYLGFDDSGLKGLISSYNDLKKSGSITPTYVDNNINSPAQTSVTNQGLSMSTLLIFGVIGYALYVGVKK